MPYFYTDWLIFELILAILPSVRNDFYFYRILAGSLLFVG